jgi:hypothetical protein
LRPFNDQPPSTGCADFGDAEAEVSPGPQSLPLLDRETALAVVVADAAGQRLACEGDRLGAQRAHLLGPVEVHVRVGA